MTISTIRLFHLSLVGAFAMAAASCFGDKSGDADAKVEDLAASLAVIDPCALLTQEEIAAATGRTVGAPDPGRVFGGDEDSSGMNASCNWVSEDAGDAYFVTLQAYSWRTLESAEEFMRTMRESSRNDMNTPPVDVDALGDDAFRGALGLVMRKRRVNLAVNAHGGRVVGGGDADVDIALARLAAARLP